jgi:hypothetical protein
MPLKDQNSNDVESPPPPPPDAEPGEHAEVTTSAAAAISTSGLLRSFTTVCLPFEQCPDAQPLPPGSDLPVTVSGELSRSALFRL